MNASDPEQVFLQEAQDLLEQLEQSLLDLERTPGNGELIDKAFRALHTIKGSGAMFGFDAVAAFTHQFETALDLVRKGQVTPPRELIAVALAAKDQMRALIDQPALASAIASELILGDLQRVMATAAGSLREPAAEATDNSETPADGAATWCIRFRLPADAMVTGTNPLLLLDELRTLGTASVCALTDGVPPLEEIDPSLSYLRWTVTLRTDQPRSAIEQVFLFVIDEMELAIEPVADIPSLPAQVTADPPPVGGSSENHPSAAAAAPQPARATAMPQHPGTETHELRTAETIRVPAERLDELMDRVGQLVIAQSRLKEIAAASNDAAMKSVTEDIERLSLELRDTTMGVRMLPIGQLFSRFRRLIHDLARDHGKRIELVTSGEETEVDKTVIERLNDPLIHLIRNAVDHGIEDPESRAAAGKPPLGRITLAATHVAAGVIIAIADDGRGLERERIRARAEENGLWAPGAKPTDSELFQVIFQPGFSTAREVTSLSGRGVGMDVVKRTIDGLRGSIDVASTAGQGSEITLRLPLTLAIIDGLLVRVGRGRYVIPLSAVEECVELSMEEDARSRGRNFLNIRGDLVPFLRLRELFNAATPADRYQKVVIVSAGELRVGLVVDQVIGDHQTVIKALSKLHANIEIFSGATILGDGTVALILDIAHLVAQGQRHEERLQIAS
ncbi:MAG TPA: chemotaxis protein CheA [Acetobacteraceae bacterium]|nr:chemotaxis protein CheA [Acetobacteraceae bacterium]